MGKEKVEFGSTREDGSAVGSLGVAVATREPVLVGPVKSEREIEYWAVWCGGEGRVKVGRRWMVKGATARVFPGELAGRGAGDALSIGSLVEGAGSFGVEVAGCDEEDGEDEVGVELSTVGAVSLHPTSASIEHKRERNESSAEASIARLLEDYDGDEALEVRGTQLVDARTD